VRDPARAFRAYGFLDKRCDLDLLVARSLLAGALAYWTADAIKRYLKKPEPLPV
jgi:hypothetical protein